MVLTIWTAAVIMFFAIPLIAIFDWIMFAPMLKQSYEEYNLTKKISPYTWIPACVMECLFFIAGIVIGYVVR